MRRFPTRRRPALAALALIVLAACGNEPSAVAPPCPSVVIVKDTAEYTTFRPGGGRDLTDVVLDARIDRFDGSCETEREDDRSGRVTIDMQVFFEATRGPANDKRTGSFDYFVAIADRDGTILAKQVFTTQLSFEGNRNRVGAIDELTQAIPLAAGQTGEDFEVFIGFQLSPEQLEYNRAKQQR